MDSERQAERSAGNQDNIEVLRTCESGFFFMIKGGEQMATIDELSIEVQSSAKKVDNSIDKAAKQLEHLASATSKVSASKLNSISVGLNNISKSLRGLKDATL